MQNRGKIIDYLVILVVTLFSGLYLKSYLESIFFGWHKYTFLCSDFGQYISHGEHYVKEGAELIKIMAVGEEPGLFLISSNLQRIMGFEETGIALILCGFIINLLIGLTFYCGIKRVTGSSKFGLLGVLIIVGIFTYSRATNLLVLRQLLSIAFLLIFALNGFYYHNRKNILKKITLSIIIGGTILAHRSGLVLLLLSQMSVIVYFLIKKDYPNIKEIISIICISILFSGPFLVVQSLDLIRSLLWDMGIGSVANIFDSGLGQNSNLVGNNTGFSYLVGGETQDRAIYHYFIHQGIYLIPGIAFLKTAGKIFRKNQNIINFWGVLLVLLVYISTRMDFSVRMLVGFEIFYIFFLIILLHKEGKNRLTIIFFISIFLIGLLSLAKPVIAKNRAIPSGEDVKFIQNNISKSGAYILGDFCISDFASQLGFSNANNFESAPLWKGWTLQEGEGEGVLNYYAHLKLSKTLSESISEKPYIYKSFENIDLYIMFLSGMSEEKIFSLTKSPYLEMIYKGGVSERIKYIFKVKKENVIYFDTTNYIYKN